MDCQSCTGAPKLDWLEVEIGDMISLSVGVDIGVARDSYECPLASDGLPPLLMHETCSKTASRGDDVLYCAVEL